MNVEQRNALLALDMYLSDQDEFYCRRSVDRACVLDFDWSDVYYLSDGGISRIGFFRGRLYLTSNSSHIAKERWSTDEGQKLRANLEKSLTPPSAAER